MMIFEQRGTIFEQLSPSTNPIGVREAELVRRLERRRFDSASLFLSHNCKW